ncbi:MAG: hypothetical protein KJ065_05010 [Anaerolineae bacterium]|nr:hypothetical protein [Anaerolineae bacterium]
MQRTKATLFVMLFSFLFVGIGVTPVTAQMPRTISLGSDVQGELTPQQPIANFMLRIDTPQTVSIQLRSLTSGFAPTFVMLAPSNTVVHRDLNPIEANIIEATVSLTETGEYPIQIQRAGSLHGRYLITAQAVADAAVPTPLSMGELVIASVNTQTSPLSYSFAASPNEAIILNVQAPSGSLYGPTVTLKDAVTDETLAFGSARLLGVSYRLPPGNEHYEVVISISDEARQDAFMLCVGTESSAVPCP